MPFTFFFDLAEEKRQKKVGKRPKKPDDVKITQKKSFDQ